MRIAAISDLHIGPRGRGDTFGHPESAFHGFLDDLERTHDRIVLVGDVYQTEHGVLPGRAAAARELRAARRRLSGLARRLDAYTYVHGNHDAIARDELGAPSSLRIEADGMRVYFVHGHQFDPLLRGAYPIPQIGTWLTGQLRTTGLGRVAQAIEDQDISLKHRRFHRPGGPYLGAAQALIETEGLDVVVMGHTHVATQERIGAGWSINTGSCSRGQFSWATVDTAARTTAIHWGGPEGGSAGEAG